jgi:hypothetical protein
MSGRIQLNHTFEVPEFGSLYITIEKLNQRNVRIDMRCDLYSSLEIYFHTDVTINKGTITSLSRFFVLIVIYIYITDCNWNRNYSQDADLGFFMDRPELTIVLETKFLELIIKDESTSSILPNVSILSDDGEKSSNVSRTPIFDVLENSFLVENVLHRTESIPELTLTNGNKIWEWRDDLSDTTQDTQELLSEDDAEKSFCINERSRYDYIFNTLAPRDIISFKMDELNLDTVC